ncbi:MAG TPA: Nramp family divalent metal transporter [bacterium]|nr:Nramp family divalent metal transporter [bacterium]
MSGATGDAGVKKRGFLRVLPYLGPAFIASVAYIDPGNYATNIQAGSEFGYTLLWVIFASNITAILVQATAAKLGIATGKNLAEHCRDNYPKWATYGLWIMMEIVAIATDLAEFLGAAVGLQLLFGLPLLVGGIITALATFLILGVERFGFRPLEAIITGFVVVVAVSYLVETILDRPDWGAMAQSFNPPRLPGAEGALLAAGILGATVMPHAIFLHSALTQNRMRPDDEPGRKRLFRFELIDVLVAMGVASFVNAAMLVMAAATFHRNGMTNIATLEKAYVTLEPLLGKSASVVFGISLLASGLSSSAVGTSAGQIIMEGFIHKHIPVWIRRLVTVAPSILIIAIGLEPTRVLVISQVLLSFGLPVTIFSLLRFSADRRLMGSLVNSRLTSILLGLAAFFVSALNIFLIVKTLA